MKGLNLGVVVTAFFALIVSACSGSEPQPEQVTTEAVEAPTPNVSAPEIQIIVPPRPTAEELAAEARKQRELCWPDVDPVADLTTEVVEEIVAEIRGCDPQRETFTVDGRIRDDDWLPGAAPGVNLLGNLQVLAYRFQGVKVAFENMPTLKRREILQPVANLVAAFVVEYVHKDHLKEWLLNLDWSRDIDAVNPGWYESTEWPENRFEAVEITGFSKLSKIDLWVRMFWRRRGELVFETAKSAVSKALAAKAGG